MPRVECEGAPAGRHVDVAIIGTGFSGLCMAIKLAEAGIRSFTLFERADDVGGTWRDNTYPGCACDIPSHLYSFSFEQNPEWSRTYPPQPEIQAYLRHCARKHGLAPHIRFGTEVAEAAFDAATGRWTIRSTAGETFTANVLVNGSGPLSRPARPDLPGLGDFAGPCFHSAAWDHGVDLAGKRVAVVGTGASAIQIVPAIAPVVERLHVFQRTAPWVVARPDRAYRAWEKALFRRVPAIQRLYRSAIYWQQETFAFGFLGNARFMRWAEELARQHIAETIADPALRRAVTPDYAIGCKRILISNDYYPALTRDNVELVTSGIAEVRRDAIVTRDGTARPVDVLILGTGFAATDFLAPMKIYGPGGQELSETWTRGAETHLGITVAGFPNLFLIVGPNTGLGHNSMVFMIEAQVRYVVQCIARLRREGLTSLEVRASVQEAFSREVQARMRKTVWLSGCRSWYLGPDGRNFTLWPGFTVDYWRRTRRVRAADFAAR